MPKFRVEPKVPGATLYFGDSKSRRTESLWLGRLAEIGGTRPRIHLDCSTEHVVSVVGKRGSGKSFTLGVLLEGLAAAGTTELARIVPTHAALLLDSLNIYWPSGRLVPAEPPVSTPSLLEQAKLLKAWTVTPTPINVDLWAPAGFRPGYLQAEEVKEFAFETRSLESQDWADLFEIDLLRDPMGQALEEAWRKATVDGWRSQRGPVTVPAEPGLDTVLRCLQEDTDLLRHYARETLRALQQRFRSFSAHQLFAVWGTPLTELLTPGRLTILLLGEVPDDLRRVFVSVLARRMLIERGRASGIAKQRALGLSDAQATGIPPCWFMVDEAQNFLPSGKATAATEALVRFVREGRNSGLSFVVTTQQPTAVDSRIMAQVDTLIAHQLVTARDVQVVLENLKSPAPRSIKFGAKPLKLSEAIPLLDVGQAMVTSAELPRAIFADIRPRVSIHGGFEA